MSSFGEFRRLSGKAKNNFPIYGFDVETEHVRKDFRLKGGRTVRSWRQDFVMGSVVGKDFRKVFWDKKEMQDFMLSWRMRDSMMVATNLEFDFGILFNDRLSEFRPVFRNGLIAAIKRNREDRIKDGKVIARNRTWTFNDSMNYMRAGLDKLGKVVGLPKMSMPSTMERTEGPEGIIARRPRTASERQELEDYNVNDSTITYLFMEKFREFCNAHNMKMKLTIASTGMDYWRRNHMIAPMTQEPKEQLRKHFMGSFRGGCTTVFKRGTYDDRLWYYDYRSSYPAVMVKGVDGKGSYPFPGQCRDEQKGTVELIERYEGICHASIKAPDTYFPMLGVKTGDKLLFPSGTFDGWFTNYELRKAMDLGYEVSPGEMIYYYDTFKPFKEAVTYLYKLRRKYKEDKHVFESMVKLLMNSGLFGKWGFNWTDTEEVFSAAEVVYDAMGRATHDGKDIGLHNVMTFGDGFNGYVSVKKESKPPAYSFPIISSYTTMLGRLRLNQDLSRHAESLVYCDTDSGVMTSPCLDESEDLGGWELEHKCKGGVFIKPKLYMLNIDDRWVCRSKGVGRFMSTHDDFIGCISDGRVQMARFSKLKESAKRGISPGSVMLLAKMLGLEDDKRDWKGKRFCIDSWQDSGALALEDGMHPGRMKVLRRKAMQEYDDARERELDGFLESDLFDRHSVGDDISSREFFENEMLAQRFD